MDKNAPLRALRVELLAAHPARPLVYAVDLVLSAAVGWASLWTAAHATWGSAMHLALTTVAVLALLRAGFFLHEAVHQRKALPWLLPLWAALVGTPLLIPAFMLDAHTDHHRLATYGTRDDPEYEALGDAKRWRLLLGLAVMIFVGPALAARALVISPLSLAAAPLLPRARAVVLRRMSTLATNERYVNRTLADTPRVIALELACTSAAWAIVVACATGALPWAVPLQWLLVSAAAMVINQARTQLAHGYARYHEPMSLDAQVADSTTTDGPWWSTGLVHPLGTRFHALHHLAPSLPYHAMPQAHRWLLTRTHAEHPYRAASRASFSGALVELWGRWRLRVSPARTDP